MKFDKLLKELELDISDYLEPTNDNIISVDVDVDNINAISEYEEKYNIKHTLVKDLLNDVYNITFKGSIENIKKMLNDHYAGDKEEIASIYPELSKN